MAEMISRKRLIVDKAFQYNFIKKNILLLLFTFLLIFVVLTVWEKFQVQQGFLHRFPENKDIIAWASANNVRTDSAEFMRQFIQQSKVYTFFQLLWKPMALVLIINALVLFIANLYYSHNIAGPIHHLTTLLERRLRGEEVEQLHFRKNDAFYHLAELINRTLEHKDNPK